MEPQKTLAFIFCSYPSFIFAVFSMNYTSLNKHFIAYNIYRKEHLTEIFNVTTTQIVTQNIAGTPEDPSPCILRRYSKNVFYFEKNILKKLVTRKGMTFITS